MQLLAFLGALVGIAAGLNQLGAGNWLLIWLTGLFLLGGLAWELANAVLKPTPSRGAVAAMLGRIVAAPDWHEAYDQFRLGLLARLEQIFGSRLFSIRAISACLYFAFGYPAIALFIAWAAGAEPMLSDEAIFTNPTNFGIDAAQVPRALRVLGLLLAIATCAAAYKWLSNQAARFTRRNYSLYKIVPSNIDLLYVKLAFL